MNNLYRKFCLICNSPRISDIINLGMHPFADKFIKKAEKYMSEMVFPLIIQLCKSCGNIQQKVITIPEQRYIHNEYSYTSSNSIYSKKYWKNYAREIIKKEQKRKILEIGSNDGYLLCEIKKMDNFVVGVDPSPTMIKLSKRKGIVSLEGLFSEKFAIKIKKKYKKFDIIIANNVLNHSNDPNNFFKGLKKVLNKDGSFITENPYWLDTIALGYFDQIYHEHVSYFTIKSLKKICELNKLYIYDIIKTNYHGSSIRLVIGLNEYKENKKLLNKYIKLEEKQKIFDFLFYKKLTKKINIQKINFLKKVIDLKKKSKRIICIGAAAKANTFLNFYGLNGHLIDFITDQSKRKIGKITPLSRIPIRSDKSLKKLIKPYVIFTAWNISNLLQKKILKINPECRIIKHFKK